MVGVKHIFFDLDRTLWDFETNSKLTLEEIFNNFELCDLGIPDFESFRSRYLSINEALWDEYREEKITKEFLRYARFLQTLQLFGIDQPELARSMGDYYVTNSPIKTALFPYAKEVLAKLQSKYVLHIITNGFDEVQHVKLDNCGLAPFFTTVVTSDKAGTKKPEPQIFEYALNAAQAQADESIMIGDDLKVDLEGAAKVGMRTVYFNPHQKTPSDQVDETIESLNELLLFL